MLGAVHTLNIFLPVLYAASFAVYYSDFIKQKNFLYNSKRIFLFITLVLHTFYLLARTIEFNHPPITNKYEIFTVLSFAIAFSYFVLELLSDIRGTGVFIISFALVFQVISSLLIEDLIEVKEVLRNRLLGLHVISALLGYSGFIMSAVYGLLFTSLYKEIKLNKFGLIFERLPSLETLEKLSFYSVVIGFVLLTFSIIIGIIWLPEAFPNFSFFDPKLISTFIVWFVFGFGIVMKTFFGWYGKKVIKFFLAGFILMLLSMFLFNILADSFHSFY